VRYRFGPVSDSFVTQFLQGPTEQGQCIPFNVDGPSALYFDDTWQSFSSRLVSDGPIDFLALFLQYRIFPEWVWSADLPIIGLAGDWNLQWHHYRHILRRCDFVLTDALGAEALRKEGFSHVAVANLFGGPREWIDQPTPVERDIDVLFVGNVHPIVQAERLPWLARVARLSNRWNVRIASGVFGDDYRQFLGRSRIVFNRSIRGECNMRVFEAIACGALLFQEEGNREVPILLRNGQECILYNADNLESLIEYYLVHEEERRTITDRAHQRVGALTFERLWQEQVAQLMAMQPVLQERMRARLETKSPSSLLNRAWQLQTAALGTDPTLRDNLRLAVAEQPSSAALLHCSAIVAMRQQQLEDAANQFQNAFICDPRHVIAGASLAELLVRLGQKEFAIDQARRVLALLDHADDLGDLFIEAPLPHTDFSFLRMAWERAAFEHAGNKTQEAAVKRSLLKWWMHSLLGDVTGDPIHYYQALQCRPDAAITRSALGTTLLSTGRPAEAAHHLQQALDANPFDVATARDLHRALEELGQSTAQRRLAEDRGLLHKAAPALVPAKPWFADVVPRIRIEAPADSRHYRIAWHGDQSPLHSLSIVNRELCARLLARGHELALDERSVGPPPSAQVPLNSALRDRLGASLSAPADIHIFHKWPPVLNAPDDGYWVWMQPWEYGAIPSSWLSTLVDHVDEVWVPSNYVRRGFIDCGVSEKRVFVVPNGVAPVFFGQHSQYSLKTNKRFKFLFVGGTIDRKGFDLLLGAYGRTFRQSDDVCLVVKDMGVGTFYKGQTGEQLIAQFRSQPGAPEIEYLSQELTPEELAGLYAVCDCLVHPYRAEGFGMPIAEALACGRPVIVTAYGAALDFCNDDRAYLVPARAVAGKEHRVGNLATIGPPILAEPDLDFLRYYLRHVFDHPEEARAKGDRGSAHIREYFTWDRTIDIIEHRLARLHERPIHRPMHYRQQAALKRPDGTQPRVSLTMIVKNEEDNLGACLDSVAHLVDEMIVVDTGSTDQTVEIARSRGAKVFHFPWVDSFSAARNEAIRHATGDWVFWMDADDRLDEVNQQRLREVFASLDGGVFGYQMKCLCVADSDSGTETVVDHIRLFPNRPGIRWKYRVHEQILGAIRSAGGDVRWTDVVIQHVGYVDRQTRQRKLQRDRRLLEAENAESPDDPFTLFNLGAIYHELQDCAKAIVYLQRSLELSHPGASIVRKLYSLISRSHRQLGDLQAALKTCTDGRKYYADDPELLFQESMVAREIGDLPRAIDCLRTLLSASGEARHFASIDAALTGSKGRHTLAMMLRDAGQLTEAESQWRRLIDDHPTFIPAWLGISEILLTAQRWDQLLQLASRLEQIQDGKSEADTLRARSFLARQMFDQARRYVDEAIRLAPRAVAPRVIRSHVLLQEGKDMALAEQALLDVLALDPDHREAKHNLAVLRGSTARL